MAAAMKNRASAIFPLSVLASIAGISFWLVQVTSLDEPRRDGKNRHDPDYIITGVHYEKLDRSGQLQYTLTTDELRHYPDDDSTDLSQPRLVYLGRKKPSLTISSVTAKVSSEGETVYLQDDVRIERDATQTRPALLGKMPDLTIQTEKETAETRSPVHFTQGNSWLKGVGMHLDNKTQTYVLQSQAVGQFESRKAQARK